MTTITLTIPVPTPSLNRVLGAHWSRKARERLKWGWLVRAARLEARVYPGSHIPQQAKVTIERWGPKLLDADNARLGSKFLTDSMVKERLFADDTLACIGEPEVIQHVGKPYRTIVTIEVA